MRILIVTLLCVVIPSSAFGNDIYNAGLKDLQLFLNAIPSGQESFYGFKNRNDFADCTLGDPIQMVTINQHDYQIQPTNEWKIPIILEGNITSFLTVSMINGEWQAVEIGGSRLAREIFEIGNVQSILRLYSLRTDFVLIEQDKYLPLKSANLNFARESSKRFYSFDDIVNILKREIR